MPITSDGKEPNLKPFLSEIQDAVGKAVRKAQGRAVTKKQSIESVVLENFVAVIDDVSGEEGYRFNGDSCSMPCGQSS